MEKQLLWHELYDHMHDDRCPLCDHILARSMMSMKALLHEGVLDLGIRKQLYESKGLCGRHAHMLVELGDPLAHAVIYASLFRQAVSAIEESPNKGAVPYLRHDQCMFCTNEKTSEKLYIPVFVQAFEEERFVEKYKQSGLLCLPHLAKAIHHDKKRSEAIVTLTLEKYRILIGRLDEIMRKNDFRSTHEPWTEAEKRAWKAAVDIFNGAQGL